MRQEDGCAKMTLNGRTILVVAGGMGEGLETLDSVEFWRFLAVFLKGMVPNRLRTLMCGHCKYAYYYHPLFLPT